MAQPKGPQQRKANELYAKKEAAKRGRAPVATEYKREIVKRSAAQKFTIGTPSYRKELRDSGSG